MLRPAWRGVGGGSHPASCAKIAVLAVAVLGCQERATPAVAPSVDLVEKFVVSADSADLGRPFRAAALGDNFVFSRSTLSTLAVRTDSTGRLLGFLGPKGVGPNELAVVGPMMTKGDSLLIMDPGSSRIAVVSPNGGIVRTIPTELVGGQYALRLRGDTILVARMVGTEAGFGYPLHLITPAGGIAKSFGTEDRTVDPSNPEAKLRILIQETDSTFWVTHVHSYILERWHINGSLLTRLEPTRAWFPPDGRPQGTPPRAPGIITAGVLSDGRIAVVLFRPNPDAKPIPDDSLKRGVAPPTPQRFAEAGTSLLEVLNPKSGAMEAARSLGQEVIRGFLPHDRLFGIRELPGGSQHAVVWQLTFPQP